jgi:hypothetical protein
MTEEGLSASMDTEARKAALRSRTSSQRIFARQPTRTNKTEILEDIGKLVQVFASAGSSIARWLSTSASSNLFRLS